MLSTPSLAGDQARTARLAAVLSATCNTVERELRVLSIAENRSAAL